MNVFGVDLFYVDFCECLFKKVEFVDVCFMGVVVDYLVFLDVNFEEVEGLCFRVV